MSRLPIEALSATVKLNACALTIVCVNVADASCEPVPLGPPKIRKANVSLPAGAPNESVQLRKPVLGLVRQRLDDVLTSKFVLLPPLMLSSTDDAPGETNCG